MATLIVGINGREIKRIAIDKTTVRIGRDPTNEVVLDNSVVSRLHATLRFEDHRFYVCDEGSVNSVFVNGKAVRIKEIEDGGSFQIGKFSLELHVGDSLGFLDYRKVSLQKSGVEPLDPSETHAINLEDLRRMASRS